MACKKEPPRCPIGNCEAILIGQPEIGIMVCPGCRWDNEEIVAKRDNPAGYGNVISFSKGTERLRLQSA